MADIHITADAADALTAIGLANPNDVIIFDGIDSPFAGVNNKNLNLGGLDPLTIKGEDGKYILIDLEGSGRLITFDNGESASVILENIHIHDGDVGANNGGAIDVNNLHGDSSPTIKNCLITNCAARLGGGIHVQGIAQHPIIRDCTIVNCLATGWGGALYTTCGTYGGAVLYVYDTIIWDNDCTGGAGRGDQIHSDGTVAGNHFVNCDIKDAVADDIVGLMTLTNCIHTNPLLVSGPDGDYCLSQIAAGEGADSPCLDTGSDTAVNLGMDDKTTRTDTVHDLGTVDIGWHYCNAIPPPRTWTQDSVEHKEDAHSFKQVGPVGIQNDDYYAQEIDVIAGEDYYVEVFGKCTGAPTAGYFYLQAYAVDGPFVGEIDIAKLSITSGGEFVKFAFYFEPPGGCTKVEIRIGGNVQGGTIFWDAADAKRIRAKGYT